MHSPRFLKSPAAFTLIELLVVITIIAILASIAFPVFSKVQERARVTQDLNNLRQLGIATQTYLNDHDGIAFSTNTASGSWVVQLQAKYLPNWKVFQSPFDSRPALDSATDAPVSYGLNKNILGQPTDKIQRATAFILFAPAQKNASSVEFSGKASDSVTVLRGLSEPGGTATGGTHNSRTRINAVFADLHSDNLTWTTFMQTSTGTPEDDSNFRWDLPQP